MPAPSLPGFFYDEQKKKYFKIEPHHVRQARSSAVDAGPNREDESKTIKKSNMSDSNDEQSLKRKSLLSSSNTLNSKLFVRSMEPNQNSQQQNDDMVLEWSRNLQQTEFIGNTDDSSTMCINIKAFAYDPITRDTIHDGVHLPSFVRNPVSHIWRTRTTPDFERESLRPLPLNRTITSFATSKWPPGFAYVLNAADEWGNAAFFSNHNDDFLIEHDCPPYDSARLDQDAAYSCAVDPSGSHFGIGSERALHLISIPLEGRPQEVDTLLGGERTDAFGVGYLGPQSLISGWRSGFIKHWDTRISGEEAGLSGPFQEPGAGCLNLKVVDEYRFVTISVEKPHLPLSAMRIYDIRCGRRREALGLSWTEPVVQIPGWKCPYIQPSLPLAADKGMNLVAAPAAPGTLGLFNTQTGAEIGQLAVPNGVNCVQIVSWDGGDGQNPAILASSGGVIYKWE